jgi:glutamate--cysteine ligase catalytic subunit
MGLLTDGTPLDWNETKSNRELVKQEGIREFIHIYNHFRLLKNQPFKWGDEIEFSLVKFDHKHKRVYLLLKADQLIQDILKEVPIEHTNIDFHPEYANYMVETSPHLPFDHNFRCFKTLESNIKLRRILVENFLQEDEKIMSLTCFPLLGCPDFSWPYYKPNPDNNSITRSLFLADQSMYNIHPRFSTIAKNIRMRKNQKNQEIYVPIYHDKNTPRPFIDDSLLQIKADEDIVRENKIYMDSIGFGMGCCCLQVTFQAESIDEARFLYDQLIPLTPILLALTASSPVWRGYLSNIDARWDVLSASVDDRTDEELGLSQLENDKFLIKKSRYGSVDSYLSKKSAKFNDIDIVFDKEIYNYLIKQEVDHTMAQHISHLFIRDPLVLFKEKLDEIKDNLDSLDIKVESFENIQSTNWQTMRFKPPPLKSIDSENQIGWRVEFRPMELQLTDFQNSAFCSFIILFTKMMKKKFKNLNFLMPLSKVDENMNRAQRVDACRSEKFYFRRNIFDKESENECDLVEMTMNEIMNGSASGDFKGLLSIIDEFLNDELNKNDEMDYETFSVLKGFMKLIEGRSNGTVLTPASYIRKFIREHPLYKFDSRVTHEINYDLINHICLILNKKIECPDLLFQ